MKLKPMANQKNLWFSTTSDIIRTVWQIESRKAVARSRPETLASSGKPGHLPARKSLPFRPVFACRYE
jgi:hypothetical protein